MKNINCIKRDVAPHNRLYSALEIKKVSFIQLARRTKGIVYERNKIIKNNNTPKKRKPPIDGLSFVGFMGSNGFLGAAFSIFLLSEYFLYNLSYSN